jgi:hypothetical protein
MKFVVTGTITIDVTATIDADSEHDAQSQLDSVDCCVESCDENIIFNECCQSGSNVDEVSCPAYDKWEEMSILERANVFKDNGASDESALETAQNDNFYNLPEEWQGYFDE